MIGTNGTFQINGNAGQTRVTSAIQQASARTGVDFGYLMNQASVESSMNPNAKARTSSATGLYQFIDQTWLRMMKSHGAEHGYGKMADAIKQDRDGDYYVANKSMRSQILNLRRDPKASSLMAAELATENNTYLQNSTGAQPTSTDLYMAHFMGAQGASNFLNSMKKNPWAPAASLFPEAARANKGVFYAQGRPLSLQQVYNNFDAKFANASDTPVAQPTQMADAGSDSFVERVILPLANDWSNPDAVTGGGTKLAAQRIASANTATGLRAFSSDISEINPPRKPERIASADNSVWQGLGQRVQWPMDALFTAQTAMTLNHNDQTRYNA